MVAFVEDGLYPRPITKALNKSTDRDGELSDYIERMNKWIKKNKKGLKGRFKVTGQVGLGLLVGFQREWTALQPAPPRERPLWRAQFASATSSVQGARRSPESSLPE